MSHSSAFADQCDRSNEDEQFSAALSSAPPRIPPARLAARNCFGVGTLRSISKSSSICVASRHSIALDECAQFTQPCGAAIDWHWGVVL